jgi:diguanylate cyclase (GGDEF)-like protein/PAS domain S-box-containing protein
VFALDRHQPSRRHALLFVVLLFGGITAARFAFDDPTNGVGSLYLVPICLVAAGWGVRAALAVAVAATATVFGWTELANISSSMMGNVSRLLTFAAAAVLVGGLIRQRDRLAVESSRWFTLSNGLLCVADLDGNFVRVNPAWTEALGWTQRELVSSPSVELVHPEDRDRTIECTARLAEGPSECTNFENRYRATDGSWHWLSWTSRSDGELIYSVAKDITETKHFEQRREARLREAQAQARTDDLTGLANRRVWDDRLPSEIARARRNGSPLAVAMIDLDGLKAINDTKGHQAGSNALKSASAAWSAVVRESDLLARFGGDEFAVLMPDCSLEDARHAAERLRAALGPAPTASIGVAAWNGAETGAALVERADEVLYRAKRAGRNRVAVAGTPEPAGTAV